jgi:IS5 family transposase
VRKIGVSCKISLDEKSVLRKILGQSKAEKSEENAMRKKRNNQTEFDFQPSNLKITNQYYALYERISRILLEQPQILDAIHEDLKRILKKKGWNGPGRNGDYASETVLRIIICQIIEGESLRDIIIRIDDSNFLRRFVRIYNGKMMDYTTFCTLRNAIRPKTWKKINSILRDAAAEQGMISGEKLRIDTTAVETNIHWPTDSGLLWDTYRVISRLVSTARKIDPEAVSDRRLQPKRAKRIHTKIARRSGKKQSVSKPAKELYGRLIGLVDGILGWTPSVCERLRAGLAEGGYGVMDAIMIESVIDQLEHFRTLGLKVVDQARRRVIEGEQVPNDEKIFSIFESHTELIKRGKAGKPIEFGHMIKIQQVEGKFITDYEVFQKKPVDHTLLDSALESHLELFGDYPDELSADKGFFESVAKIAELEMDIEVVSIPKKGSRSEEEAAKEKSESFRLGQRFRAGVEGTISVLKRAFRMWRCMNKGWDQYVATIGAAVFTHNLVVLARGYG